MMLTHIGQTPVTAWRPRARGDEGRDQSRFIAPSMGPAAAAGLGRSALVLGIEGDRGLPLRRDGMAWVRLVSVVQ
jgi:hypothetical protein